MNDSNYNQGQRPQDDIPYEVIVKYIIRDYRRLRQALDMLGPYTRQLEEIVQQQNNELLVVRKCQKDNEWLHTELKEAQERIRVLSEQVKQLKENRDSGSDDVRLLTKRMLVNRVEQLEQWLMSYGMEIPAPDRNIRQWKQYENTRG